MKTYKIKLENNKNNIYYFDENGNEETKEFFIGEVKVGYELGNDSLIDIELLNKLQYNEMQPYDWYFVRKIRKGVEVPQNIIDTLNAIDEKYNALKNV